MCVVLVENLTQHCRFKCLHKATLVRVLLSNYSSGHEGLRGRLEHYYEIIHCCK